MESWTGIGEATRTPGEGGSSSVCLRLGRQDGLLVMIASEPYYSANVLSAGVRKCPRLNIIEHCLSQ